MISPLQAVIDWLKADPNWDAYDLNIARGMWRDSVASPTKRYAQVMLDGGRAPVIASYNLVKLTLLGPQKGTAVAGELEQIAVNLRERLYEDYKACDVAQIRLVGGIIGPGYTAEDRPWVELNLEILS